MIAREVSHDSAAEGDHHDVSVPRSAPPVEECVVETRFSWRRFFAGIAVGDARSAWSRGSPASRSERSHLRPRSGARHGGHGDHHRVGGPEVRTARDLPDRPPPVRPAAELNRVAPLRRAATSEPLRWIPVSGPSSRRLTARPRRSPRLLSQRMRTTSWRRSSPSMSSTGDLCRLVVRGGAPPAAPRSRARRAAAGDVSANRGRAGRSHPDAREQRSPGSRADTRPCPTAAQPAPRSPGCAIAPPPRAITALLSPEADSMASGARAARKPDSPSPSKISATVQPASALDLRIGIHGRVGPACRARRFRRQCVLPAPIMPHEPHRGRVPITARQYRGPLGDPTRAQTRKAARQSRTASRSGSELPSACSLGPREPRYAASRRSAAPCGSSLISSLRNMSPEHRDLGAGTGPATERSDLSIT